MRFHLLSNPVHPSMLSPSGSIVYLHMTSALFQSLLHLIILQINSIYKMNECSLHGAILYCKQVLNIRCMIQQTYKI